MDPMGWILLVVIVMDNQQFHAGDYVLFKWFCTCSLESGPNSFSIFQETVWAQLLLSVSGSLQENATGVL